MVITGSMRSSSAGSMWQAMRWPAPKVRTGGSCSSQILPDYGQQRRWLRGNGHLLTLKPETVANPAQGRGALSQS